MLCEVAPLPAYAVRGVAEIRLAPENGHCGGPTTMSVSVAPSLVSKGLCLSANGPIVLQNYFHDQNEQY